MSASISKRRTTDGKTRYLVRYRLGGRSYPVKNAGTFTTERLAKVRRDLIAGEIAAGRDPAILLASLGTDPAVARTFKAGRRSTARAASTSPTKPGWRSRHAPARWASSVISTRRRSLR